MEVVSKSSQILKTSAVIRISLFDIDVINVYNVYKKFFVNVFIILSTFISIKIT